MAERFRSLRIAILAALSFGCSEDVTQKADAAPGAGDTGGPPDGGRLDAAGADAAGPDLGGRDSGRLDAAERDATVGDAAVADASRPDAEPRDVALGDANAQDAAVPDAAVPDAAVPDAAVPDAATIDGGTTSSECAPSTPILGADGTPSGVVRCVDGSLERVAQPACAPTVAGTACEDNPDAMRVACAVDADCDARSFGHCVVGPNFGAPPACNCAYGCATDADCGPAQTCVCAGVVGESRCVSAGCRTGADCASGACGVGTADDGCSVHLSLACRTDGDVCRGNPDCDDFAACLAVGAAESWVCQPQPICGRPLHIDDRARTAPLVERGDWGADVTPSVADLSDAARAERADFWAQVGALEHASVAGFARFSLQLMALGAPPDLLAEAQRAGADEVEHARLAYGLASAYAGRAMGPGPMRLGDLRIEADVAAVVRDLVREACVGETLGAAEAAAAVDADPVVRAVWRRIAADEQRHAVLGWRTLAWILDGADASLRRAARHAFAEALAGFGGDAAHAEAIATVVRPAMAAMGMSAAA